MKVVRNLASSLRPGFLGYDPIFFSRNSQAHRLRPTFRFSESPSRRTVYRAQPVFSFFPPLRLQIGVVQPSLKSAIFLRSPICRGDLSLVPEERVHIGSFSQPGNFSLAPPNLLPFETLSVFEFLAGDDLHLEIFGSRLTSIVVAFALSYRSILPHFCTSPKLLFFS